MAKIGLVAGGGNLPIIFADMAKKRGDTVVVFGVRGITDEGIEKHAAKTHWLAWGDLKKAAFLLVTEGIRKIILLGKIRKDIFFKEEDKLDEASKKILATTKDKSDYGILNQVEKFLKTMGIEIIDSTTYLRELIPQAGVLTKRSPREGELKDIAFGKEMASGLAKFDIGQAVAVKEKTPIAVEAAEGTDEMIKRAGAITDGGFVVVKVARPEQDMRFDVPLVGLETLKTLIDSGCICLAVESGKTLLLDKDEMIKLADENGVSIVAI